MDENNIAPVTDETTATPAEEVTPEAEAAEEAAA